MGCANDDPLNESGPCTIKAGTENNKQNWTDTAGKNAGILAIVTSILSRMSKARGYSREKELYIPDLRGFTNALGKSRSKINNT